MMRARNSDKTWDYFGRRDPYFGVITHDQFRRENLTEESKSEFFATGERHVEQVLSTITGLDAGFQLKRALDFGCGVGRVVVPLAQRAEEVTGIDVSDAMLQEARRNCAERNLHNVHLVVSDDQLAQLIGSYDLVHSFVVFQHIPPRRGEKLFRLLLERLAIGGWAVLQFTYAKTTVFKRLYEALKHIPFAMVAVNAYRRRPLSAPVMEMNSYSLNALLKVAQDSGFTECHIQFTDHGGALGAVLYLHRTGTSETR